MYKYGVSFNCCILDSDGVSEKEIGGAEEGFTSTDYVGNDLTKIEEALCKNEYEMLTDHPHVGNVACVGGEIVAVFVDRDGSVVSVVFTEPNAPTVIE